MLVSGAILTKIREIVRIPSWASLAGGLAFDSLGDYLSEGEMRLNRERAHITYSLVRLKVLLLGVPFGGGFALSFVVLPCVLVFTTRPK